MNAVKIVQRIYSTLNKSASPEDVKITIYNLCPENFLTNKGEPNKAFKSAIEKLIIKIRAVQRWNEDMGK